MGDTSRSQTIATQHQQIAEQAARKPDMVFTRLMHHIDVGFLQEAYRRTRKSGAPGLSGQTAKEYAVNLAANLQDLYERMRAGRYQAPPIKRAWLDKEDGSKRPIGVPEFEDKIVQRAVSMLLEAVYEQDFYDFSHGFRREHSPHQALAELRERCLKLNINWIVDADVSGFFDHLDHSKLREIITQRVNDGGLLRYIGKWLNAGVVAGEALSYPKRGTPQGGVVSPMLANIFLHHVLDDWFVKQVQPRLKGRSFLLRFADDFIIGCELEADARRIMAVLPKRFGRFGLSTHSEKTRLVSFSKPDPGSTKGEGTFDFLGFTHYWAKSRRGYWVIKRMTARKRLRRSLKTIWQWCREHRHLPLKEQYRILSLKLRGPYQYYGIRNNHRMLNKLYQYARKAWRFWLSRRSHKGNIVWEKFEVVWLVYPLPRPNIVHNI